MTSPTLFKKLLVANRGEIAIRVLRAASELNIRTVSIFTYADRFSPHRYKADEAYMIGNEEEPLKPYLDIEQIVETALANDVDAIHPGYGFLAENVDFARRCQERGITFIGPQPQVMEALGDKVAAKTNAVAAGLPVIEDSQEPLESLDIALREGKRIGYPVMLKAVAGGGGRGMRAARSADQLAAVFEEARSEALSAFGNDTVFLEKYIDSPKHIEVQILGDCHGNLVHLYERDCSVQRRFQKVVEIAPSTSLTTRAQAMLHHYALAIGNHVSYQNAGTVEFLVDAEENIYFIEVNPRIQVEHTITEEVTGIDIVRSQIHVAAGYRLSDAEVSIPTQESISCNGYAIQCRITTEDPENGFQPDYGKLIAYRSAGGFGIRLDAGAAYAGAEITPHFDSLLVKVSAWGRTFAGATQRLDRALREFRVRGVKTNTGFLENVLAHPKFMRGEATVTFIDQHPELFVLRKSFDRATKLLRFLASVTVNGNPDITQATPNRHFRRPVVPTFDSRSAVPPGTRDRLKEMGATAFCDWVREQQPVLFTDTTCRDAHQSLLATRVRTQDMLPIAAAMANNHPQLFSLEVWGGATFDVAMRFLHECPWERLEELREAIPNILLQMLFRGSNAVGYRAYPQKVIREFIERSWRSGIDVFRIFDSLNWIEGMRASIGVVREHTDGIAEAAICYTGDVLDGSASNRYNLDYYLDLARSLEEAGAHILALKDMAGLLKPYAAEKLIPALRETVNIPIHLHTHETAGVQSATVIKAIEAGVDIVDACVSSVSGLTSQPSLNSLVAALAGHPRESGLDLPALNSLANYWEDVREFYAPFESGLKAPTAEVYEHEIPGGQYSNLRPQAEALGLGGKFQEIKKKFAIVNRMFGNIVKVTPSSKVVGDMALFMTANGLSEQDVMENGEKLAFPDSVIDLFKGRLGQVPGGFPAELSRIVLKGDPPPDPGQDPTRSDTEEDGNFDAFQQQFGAESTQTEYLSWKMYPAVFQDFNAHREEFGDVSRLPTPAFFYGMLHDESITVTIGRGKVLIISLLYVSKPDDTGMCSVTFELNGQRRSVRVRDQSASVTRKHNRKAVDASDIGAPLQGRVAQLLVEAGDTVAQDDPLFVIEAMKMETTVTAPVSGRIDEAPLAIGAMVEQGDLVVVLK